MAVSFVNGALIVANLIAFIIKIVFNAQANTVSRVFPVKTGDVSTKNQTDLTPAPVTFAIWGVIYLLQLSWIIYTLSLIVRPAAPDILPAWFYIAYMVTCCFNVTWLIVWAHQKIAAASAVLFGITLSLVTCLALAYNSLDSYLMTTGESFVSSIDVWCIRALVLNGLMFYTAWVSIASCINFAIFLQRDVGLTRSRAGSIALSMLLAVLLVWFALENFTLSQYTKYTFSEYVVLIIGLFGVLRKQWTDGRGNQTYVLALFVLSILMFGARLMIILITSGTNEKNLAR